MSQLFPKSILLHFPSEVYLRRGVGELFPLLVRALHEIEIVAMQFLRGGRIRVTVRSEAYREDLLSSEFRLKDTVVPVTPADCVAKSVYVRDLPFEVSDKSIVSVFFTYGKVYSVKSVYYNEFSAICTGTRIVLMSVNNPVLSVVNVHGFECRVWCPGRPAIYPGPVHSRAFAGVASSPVTWLVSVGRPGASLVLRPPRLFRHRDRLRLLPIPSLILFPLRPILFLSLIPFLMIRLHLLQPLFRLTGPLLLMTIFVRGMLKTS